jgi:uncharacterized protein
MLVVGVLLAVLVGVTLGLLGGGGSIVTLPILLYVVRVAPEQAIASSLLVVGATSAATLFPHARAGRVHWNTGLLFGVASMVGAYVGGRCSSLLPPSVLMLAFGTMMLVTATAMMRPRRAQLAPREPSERFRFTPITVLGLVVGAVTGLVGAGGGFLVVPTLVLLGRLPIASAVGTSLLVIAMNSAAGLAGHLAHTHVTWGVVLPVMAASVCGSLLGSRLTGRVDAETLRRGFAWFVMATAVCILGNQLIQLCIV